jgi:23S rRNA (cytosine1962-C5)-methyltransferase
VNPRADRNLKPASSNPTVTLSRRAADRLRAGHVWAYRSDVKAPADVPPGALVNVQDDRGRPLGSALYSTASEIAVRLISNEVVANDEALLGLLRERVRNAIVYRQRIVEGENDAYRLIFSEADELPGLIVDRYNQMLSLQALTQAMDRQEIRAAIIAELMESLGAGGVTSIVERIDPRVRQLEQLPPASDRLLAGEQSSAIYKLNGIQFRFDAFGGQKTGAFLDQRENYAAAARYAHGRALDAFCYQGGFALHLAPRCASVTGVDSSRPALEVAEANEALNPGHSQIEWMEANAFDLLRDYSAAGEQYDTIVLDPPAFAKSKRTLETAMRGYKELNLRALKMLRPGGVLVTGSCSYHVSDGDFLAMFSSAAADAHRKPRLLEHRAQSKDHPIVIGIPETHYLKCFIFNL